jgi:hypothetical protein
MPQARDAAAVQAPGTGQVGGGFTWPNPQDLRVQGIQDVIEGATHKRDAWGFTELGQWRRKAEDNGLDRATVKARQKELRKLLGGPAPKP